MGHFLFLFLSTAVLFNFSAWAQPLVVDVTAEAAILMNAETGAILFEKNAHTLYYPASITKIVTASYALRSHSHKLDTVIAAEQEALVWVSEEAKRRANFTLPAYWLIPGGSHIGIKKGEELSLRDLLYGLMLESGGDAANVIAMHVSGSVPNFMTEVNSYLKEIGCQKTTFMNPHGTHHPKHQTTAYDMAVIMREALKNPTFCEIIKTVTYPRPKTNKQESRTFLQTNKLMRKGKYYYPKAIGGKTGYYSLAGNTLVVAASHQNRTLISVVLKANGYVEAYRDTTALFEAAFNQPRVRRVLIKAGSQKFTREISGATTPLVATVRENVSVEYYPAEEPQLKCMLYWNVDQPSIAKDQLVGELRLQAVDGQVVKTAPLFAQEAVTSTWWWWAYHLL